MGDRKMKKGRNWFVTVIILLVIVFAVYSGFNWWNRDIVAIKTATVVQGDIQAVISASGIVDAPVYELGTKMGGKIGDLKVKEGEIVKKGQLLAEFDNYDQARNDFQRTRELYQSGAASQQSLDAARTMYESSRIVSPDKGVVAKINYRVGETVVPGQPAIVVVNYDQSWVEAQIDEIDISNVKMGNKVTITTDVYPDQVFEGEIYWIAPLAELRKVGGRVKMDEESYVFPCKIKFLGDHSNLMANMSVNVDIVTKISSNTVIIPREALFAKNSHSVVFVVSKNQVYEQTLVPGIRSFSSVEAVRGVSAGEIVAISNLSKLKNKGRIKIER
jgi:multidrug efflux pump subunit AcrA (membrane-fusion protein)